MREKFFLMNVNFKAIENVSIMIRTIIYWTDNQSRGYDNEKWNAENSGNAFDAIVWLITRGECRAFEEVWFMLISFHSSDVIN